MLEFLRNHFGQRDQRMRRKIRLFGRACCQSFLSSLRESSRKAVEASELYADGTIAYAEFRGVWTTALETDTDLAGKAAWWRGLALLATNPQIWAATRELTRRLAIHGEWRHPDHEHVLSFKDQALLLRDIVRYPTAAIEIGREWKTRTVASLGRAIYDDRAFDRMPILADALEDAGCSAADILAHCRGGGEHVRGCWVVDLLLGKE
jgi:hypothetical protein